MSKNHRVPGTPGGPLDGLAGGVVLQQPQQPAPTMTVTTEVVMNCPVVDFFDDANDIVPYLGVKNMQTGDALPVIGFRPVSMTNETVFTYYVVSPEVVSWLYDRLAAFIQARGTPAATVEWSGAAAEAISSTVAFLDSIEEPESEVVALLGQLRALITQEPVEQEGD